MPNRVIKDSIWTSPTLAKLEDYYEDQWSRWVLMADDWGCFNADPEIIKGVAYPKRKEKLKKIDAIRRVYYEAGLVFFWRDGDREWGYFVSWDHHQFCNATSVNDSGKYEKHRRKTPEPPEDLLTQYLQADTKSFDKFRQVSTKSLKPIPNPIPDLKPNPKPTLAEAIEYYSEKLGPTATKMESVIYDFKRTRKTNELAPGVLIRIVDYWLKFSSQALLEAKAVWDEQRYAHEGKDEKYFNGILRRVAKEVEIRRASQVGAHR